MEAAKELAAGGPIDLATARRAFGLTRSRRKHTLPQVKAALTRCNGLVFLTARLLGTTNAAVEGYLAKFPTLRAHQQQCAGLVNDEAELALFKEARKGAPWAVMFLLKHKARERGYVERTEHQEDREVRVRVEYATEPIRELPAAVVTEAIEAEAVEVEP